MGTASDFGRLEAVPDFQPAFGAAPDGTPIPGIVRRSDRARRVSVVVHPDRVELVVPTGMPLDGPRGALAFLEARHDWVRRTWARVQARIRRRQATAPSPPPIPPRLEHGALVLHRGERLALCLCEGDVPRPKVERTGPADAAPHGDASPNPATGGLRVTLPRGLNDAGRDRSLAVAVRAWTAGVLLAEARRLAHDLAPRLGGRVTEVRLTRARTRWGSCSATGVIRVNAALAAAPPDLLEYLVAHEVAHLRWRGHGPRFYAALAKLLPDWEERRRRLRAFESEHPHLLRPG